MPGFVLNTENKESVLQMIQERRTQAKPRLGEEPLSSFPAKPQDVWVILIDVISACFYDPVANQYQLGQQFGYVWRRIDVPTETDNSQSPFNVASTILVPSRDTFNNCRIVRVFNAFAQTGPSCIPLPGVQDVNGDIYLMDTDAPPMVLGTIAGGSTTSTTTSTSTSSTTTTLNPNPCSGRCKYTWSVANQFWTKISDGCALTTTTTTSTTTTTTTTSSTSSSSTSSTTTIDPCNCRVINSTSTSSTTTLPPDACHCAYPNYCGTVDGECTFTFCQPGYPVINVRCTSSTTSTSTTTSTPATTCDCNGLPITPPGGPTVPPGCLSCIYTCSGGQWVLIQNSGCSDFVCPDPAGFAPCTGCGTMIISPIPKPGGTPGKVCNCGGMCRWHCDPATNRWWLFGGFCNGTYLSADGTHCFDCGNTCYPPSVAANCTDCQDGVETACTNSAGGGNSTTLPPQTTPPPGVQCTNCNSTSTSSSTTTTCEPHCGCGCTWVCGGGIWVIKSNNCSAPCTCPYPTQVCTDTSCETYKTACVIDTTTSTTSTTTTSTTTTSTTTTCAPDCSFGGAGSCSFRWSGTSWSQISSGCLTYCSPCTALATCTCYQPGSAGSFPGETRKVDCVCPTSSTSTTVPPSTTSTTTTSTTTTSTTTTSTTSTTSTTTTSTTTTASPCGSSSCTYTCQNTGPFVYLWVQTAMCTPDAACVCSDTSTCGSCNVATVGSICIRACHG